MKGVSLRQTKLGWTVARVHYSADPDKDPARNGKAWYEHARKGMRERDWRKEFEVDYTALGGALLFPQFDPSVHLVEPFVLNPSDWTIYEGADVHPRVEHAFVWMAVNRSGELVIPYSYWPNGENERRSNEHQSRLTVKDYCKNLGTIETEFPWLKPWYRTMDPAAQGFNATETRSIMDAYRDENYMHYPSKKNRDWSSYDMISESLKLKPFAVGSEEILKPKLTIMAGMGSNDELANELRSIRYREWRGANPDKDPPQDPIEKDRHLLDALGYIFLTDPIFVDQRGKLTPFQPVVPSCAY